MSFITLCESESVNEDLLEHIIEEATVKFLIECVDQDQDDLIESLVYCVQNYYNEEEIDNTVFDYVFENFYDFIDSESMIYEAVLFESESPSSDENPEQKKGIFKRALGSIGRGISKITPSIPKFLRGGTGHRQDISTSQNIPKGTSKLGKLAIAAKNFYHDPVKAYSMIKNKSDGKKLATITKQMKAIDNLHASNDQVGKVTPNATTRAITDYSKKILSKKFNKLSEKQMKLKQNIQNRAKNVK